MRRAASHRKVFAKSDRPMRTFAIHKTLAKRGADHFHVALILASSTKATKDHLGLQDTTTSAGLYEGWNNGHLSKVAGSDPAHAAVMRTKLL